MRQEPGTPDWTLAEVQEFVPGGFEGAHVVSCSFRFVSTLVALGVSPSFKHSALPAQLRNAGIFSLALQSEPECTGR